MRCVLTIVFLLTGLASQATILPSTNSYPWSLSTVGVPGGIPNRTTIFTNMAAGSTAAQINAAIASCPSNQVVYLPAGGYAIDSTISLASYVTLRGAGIGQTFLTNQQTSYTIQIAGGGSWNAYAAISGGYTHLSSNITVASTAGLVIGRTICISQDNEVGSGPGTNGGGYVYQRDAQANIYEHHAVITATNATTISFWPPLGLPIGSNLNPVFCTRSGIITSAGAEDLTILPDSISGDGILMTVAHGCWLKNIHCRTNVSNAHIRVRMSVMCEIRGCKLQGRNGTSEGYGIMGEASGKAFGCTGLLIEDNAISDMRLGVEAERWTCSVLGYNYVTNSFANGTLQKADFSSHGPQCQFNLYEGNSASKYIDDGYHGGVAQCTVFRNYFSGIPAPGVSINNTYCVMLNRLSYWQNIVGNVLGCTWLATQTVNGLVFESVVETPRDNNPAIYVLGWPQLDNNTYNTAQSITNWNGGDYDCMVTATTTLHGNYDYYNSATNWDAGIEDHVLPNSYYLASKPSWFGTLAWPAIGPDRSPMVSMIPAEARYLGSNYLSGLGSMNVSGTLRVGRIGR